MEVAGERRKEVAEVTAGFAAADCGGRRREPPELEKKVAAGAREVRDSKGAVAGGQRRRLRWGRRFRRRRGRDPVAC